MFHLGYGSGIWSNEVGTFFAVLCWVPWVGHPFGRLSHQAFLFEGVGIGKDLLGGSIIWAYTSKDQVYSSMYQAYSFQVSIIVYLPRDHP